MSQSTLSVEVAKKYMSKTFVETGTANGEGVQTALDAGFEHIITIEANPHVFEKACRRFAYEQKVNLVLGDSGQVLPDVLRGISEPVTFWLDSHWSTGEMDLGDTVSKCPILEDLAAIRDHQVKGHKILIDDIRYFRQGIPQWGDVKLGTIMEAVMEIDIRYRIGFEPGFVENDILAAVIKE